MKIRDLIMERMGEYILREVDQLSEGVIDFFEMTTSGISDEYGGTWSQTEVVIQYRVPTEVYRTGAANWYFQGNLEYLITEMDKMEQ